MRVRFLSLALIAACTADPVALTPIVSRVPLTADDEAKTLPPIELGGIVHTAPRWFGDDGDRVRLRIDEDTLAFAEKAKLAPYPLDSEPGFVQAQGARVRVAPDERAAITAKLTIGSTVSLYRGAPINGYRVLVARGRARGFVGAELVGAARPDAEEFLEEAHQAAYVMDLERAQSRLERAAVLERGNVETAAMLAAVYRIRGLPEWRRARTIARQLGYVTPSVPEEAGTASTAEEWAAMRDRAARTGDWDLFADAELARADVSRSDGGRVVVRGELFFACKGDAATAKGDTAYTPDELAMLDSAACIDLRSRPERPPEKPCVCGCGREYYREAARIYEAPEGLDGPELEKFMDRAADRGKELDAQIEAETTAAFEKKKQLFAEWNEAAMPAAPVARVTVSNAGTAEARLRAKELSIWRQPISNANLDPWSVDIEGFDQPVFKRGAIERVQVFALPAALAPKEVKVFTARANGALEDGVWAIGLDMSEARAKEIVAECAAKQPSSEVRACFLRPRAAEWIPLFVSLPEICACRCGC